MYHHLATRFGRNSHQISGREKLDNEALHRHVPSVFAREAHDSRSERYVYVPTIGIVEGLRRDDGIGKPEAAEVIIVNSHDGTSAYQMLAGMLRFVCTNSMIAGELFEEVRVPHIRALLLHLHHSHHVGFERLSRMLRELFGIAISEGGIANVFGRMRTELDEAHQVCLAHVLRDVQYAIDCGDTVFAPKIRDHLRWAIAIGKRRCDLKDSTPKSMPAIDPSPEPPD